MIRISIGNVGSGKTASEVREMALNKSNRITYSNIKTKLVNQTDINSNMIIKKEFIRDSKTKNGIEPIYDLKLNINFWKSLNEPINIVLDEAHAIINSRRAMQKKNIIVTDWLALIRRVIGQNEAGNGELVLITQFPNRIDKIARDMATQIRFHLCHYQKTCKKCGVTWTENSELPETIWKCPRCNSFKILKHNHIIEVWHFSNIENYNAWKDGWNPKGYYNHYIIKDIENYFHLYDTLQWDNLFTEY